MRKAAEFTRNLEFAGDRVDSLPDESLDVEVRRAVSEARLLHAEFLEEREQQVRHGSVRWRYDVPAALQLSRETADHDHRQRIVIVLVAVAHAASVQHDRVVEQIPIAVGRRLQLVDEVRQHLDVITVDQGE